MSMFNKQLIQTIKNARQAVTIQERADALDELLPQLLELVARQEESTARMKAERNLDRLRNEAADRAYETFDFEADVADASGWEHSIGGDEWSRPVFLEGEPHSERVTFVVRFEEKSDEILEAYVSEYD